MGEPTNKTEIQDDDGREGSRQLSLEGAAPPLEVEGYSVVRRLGTGAYGTVWLAREDRTGRMVAIKYYPHRRGLNWSLLNREVEKLATLYTSRNIVRLLDVGWNAEPPYYVMEYVENGSLGEYLTGAELGVEEAVRITKQICGALIEAHGAGVLHCDLKPDNVLLDAQNQVRLCDFGQSRMSHEQSPALGTLYYMAPEQADLEAVPDARWDVYAVGAMIYHMLTGQPPYRDEDVQRKLEAAASLDERLKVYQQHIQESPAPTDHHAIRGVGRSLASIVDHCLAVDPQDRLPNAQAILGQLNARERNRSRRPLLLLGVVGPILLISAMVPIFLAAMQDNINEGEAQIIAGIQDANAQIAISQANALEMELESRLLELQEVVGQADTASGDRNSSMVETLSALMKRPSDEVVAEMHEFHDAPVKDRPAWLQQLDRAQQAVEERQLGTGKSQDTSWFFTDAAGRALWRRPYSEKTVGETFDYRDYFHGRNLEYPRGEAPDDISPIQEPHISLPFISRATNKYMVALSVPIRNEQGAVIGVFDRTLHLDELQKQLGQDLRDEQSSTHLIALADCRVGYQLLDHAWSSEHAEAFVDEGEAKKIFEQLRLSENVVRKIEDRLSSAKGGDSVGVREIRLDHYEDPVGRLSIDSAKDYATDWIAAISPMKSEKTPWLVIVQEKRSVVVSPIRRMESRMTTQAIYAVLASVAMMGESGCSSGTLWCDRRGTVLRRRIE